MKIGIFGGTFDPIHNIHLEIMKVAKKQCKLDLILLIPNNSPPLKEQQFITSNNDRLAMIYLAVKKYQWIKVETCELEREGISYTIDTIKYLKNKYYSNNMQFFLIIGSDQFLQLNKWKNIKEINNSITWIVANRNSYFPNSSNTINNTIFLKQTFINVSATKIRSGVELNYLNVAVNNYINNNLLYLEQRMLQQMDKKRYEHCLNVGSMAYDLAITHNCNPIRAKIAGIFHDITKQWPLTVHKQYLNQYLPEYLSEPEPTWHSYTGMLHLKYNLLMKDKNILQAVFSHTVPTVKMTKLDKLIFIADKISIERNYEKVNYFRQLAFKNLNQAFIEILQYQYFYIIKNNNEKNVGKLLKLAYNHFIK